MSSIQFVEVHKGQYQNGSLTLQWDDIIISLSSEKYDIDWSNSYYETLPSEK